MEYDNNRGIKTTADNNLFLKDSCSVFSKLLYITASWSFYVLEDVSNSHVNNFLYFSRKIRQKILKLELL